MLFVSLTGLFPSVFIKKIANEYFVFIEADTIVLAAGDVRDNDLEALLKKKNISYRITGDAATIRTAFDAIHDGFMKGMEI